MRLASVFKAVTAFTLFGAMLVFTGCSGNPEKVLVFAPAPLREQTAGLPMVPFKVKLVDVRGEPIGTDGLAVTVTLKTGTDALSGTLTVSTVGGIALFDDVVYRVAEPIVVDITAPGARPILDVPITVVPNVPAQLTFGTPPVSPVVAGSVWTPFTVELHDAYGNKINDSQIVTLSVVTPPATGVLQGTLVRNAVRGVATFDDITYNTAENITLQAVSANLVATISLAVTVDPTAGPFRLRFAATGQPQNGTTDSLQTIKVEIIDQYGNVATSRNDVITLSLIDNPSVTGEVCTGCVSSAAVNGVATFPGVKLNIPGASYTLFADVGASLPVDPLVPPQATSASFNLTHGAPASIVWVDPSIAPVDRSPATTQTAGTPWTPVAGASVAAFVLDQDGNLTTLNNSTVVSIQRQGVPVDPAFMSSSVTVAGGVAAFTAVTYTAASAVPITVQAVSGALAPSSLVNITVGHGIATNLTFTTPPASVNADSSQSIGVTVRDAYGNPVTVSPPNVTLTANTPCGANQASGLGVIAPSGGVASYSVQIGTACSGYTLTATATVGLSTLTVTSDPFVITHGAATNLNYAVAPVTSSADTRQSVDVEVRDQFNNRVTTGADSTALIALSIGTNPGVPVPGALISYVAQSATLGLAKFEQSAGGTGVQINRRGTGYTLVASTVVGAGAINTVSVPFNVTPGTATKLTFDPLVSPSAAGDAIAAAQPVNGTTDTLQSPVVKILDQFNNTVLTDSTTQISLTVSAGPGFCLNCNAVTASNGVAQFNGINQFRFSKPGTYVVTAMASTGGVAAQASLPVAITVGAPHHLKYGTAPLSQTTASRKWDNFTVQIVDEFGNLIPTATGTIDIALTPGGSPSGNGGQCPTGPFAELCGTISQASVGGVATFSDIFYNTAEVLTFTATCAGCAVPVPSNGLASDTTASVPSASVNTTIDVRPDVVDRLAFVAANSPANITQTAGSQWNIFEVQVQDSHGNVIPTSRDITIQVVSGCQNSAVNFIDNINSPPNSFKRTAILGTASFEGIQANCAGNVVITAVSGALAAADPITVQVDPLTVQRYAFIQEPAVSEKVSTTQVVQVAVIDQYDNIVTTDNSTPVILGIAVNPSVPAATCVLGCSGPTPVVNGVATIPFRLDRVGNGFILQANHPVNPTPTPDLSAVFNLTPGDPDHLSFFNAVGDDYRPQSLQRADQSFVSNSNPSPVSVYVMDQDGNVCTDIVSADSIFVDLAQLGGSVTNGGFENSSRRVNAGVASFPNVAFRTANASMDVYATSTDVPNDSNPVTLQVTNGLTASLHLINQPGVVELNADSSQNIDVEALDAYSNRVITPVFGDPASQSLTMNITPNPTNARFVVGGVALAPNAPLNATLVSGFTTFPLWIAEAGSGYKVSVSNTVQSVTSNQFTNVNGISNHLLFYRPPVNASATTVQPVVVQILDQWDNLVSATPSGAVPANQHLQAVQLTLASGVPAACAAGCESAPGNTVNAVNGVASFGVQINQENTGYVLQASTQILAPNLTLNSNSFNIVSGSASNMTFTVQPINVQADQTQEAVQPGGASIEVTVYDDFFNPIDTAVGVTLSLSPDPLGDRCVSGCGSQITVNGVATFPALQVKTPGTYHLVATLNVFGIASTQSNNFTVSAGTPNRIEFDTVPATRQTAGQTWTTFTAKVVDTFGNKITGISPQLTVTQTAGPLGGILYAPGADVRTVNPATGLATFSLDTSTRIYATVAADDYTFILTTSLGGVASTADYPIQVVGDVPDRIYVNTSSLVGLIAGTTWNPFTVEIQDAYGNVVPTSRPVTVRLFQQNTNTPVVLLDAGLSVPVIPTSNCVGGIATFGVTPTLTTDYAGNIQIEASSGSLVPSRGNVTVSPDAPNQLQFIQTPPDATTDDTLTVKVAVVDQFFNIVNTNTESVTLDYAAGGNPGGASNAFFGVNPQTTTAGVATFSILVDRPGLGYLLNAVGSTVDTGVGRDMNAGDAFDIGFGVPNHLTVNPLAPQVGTVDTSLAGLGVFVTTEDFHNNVITSGAGSATTVTLSLSGGAPGAQFVNIGGSPVAAIATSVAGAATFPTVYINKASVIDYQVSATGGGLTGGPSANLTLSAGADYKLAYTTQPANGTTDSLQTVAVAIQDRFGNATASTDSVQLSISSGPGGALCLSGCVATPAVAGTATINNVQMSKPGAYTLLATDTTNGAVLTSISSSFTLQTGTPFQVAIRPLTTPRTADQTQAVTVDVLDAEGNIVSNPAPYNQITLQFNDAQTAVPADLQGAGVLSLVSGTVVYPNVRIKKTGSSYNLEAFISGGPVLTSAPSNDLDITPGAPSALQFELGFKGVNTVSTSTQTLIVGVYDQYGNFVSTDGGRNITLSLAVDPSNGTSALSNTPSLSQPTVAGLATFSNVNVTKVFSGYRVLAVAAGLNPGLSDFFDITAGAPAKLSFEVQPANTTADLFQSVTVAVRDANDNLVSAAVANRDIRIEISPVANPGGTTITNDPLTVVPVGGFATFSGGTAVNIDTAANGYRLRAEYEDTTGPSVLFSTDSSSFNVTAGVATQLNFVSFIADTTADLTQSVEVELLDNNGNRATTATNPVSLSYDPFVGFGAVPILLDPTVSGGEARSPVNGIVIFPNVGLDKAGFDFGLDANASGLGSAQSNNFDITHGFRSALTFDYGPDINAVSCTSPSPSPLTAGPIGIDVCLLDDHGNLVDTGSGANGLVTSLSYAVNAGGSTASLLNPSSVTAGGVASFPARVINKVGVGYVLAAAAGGGIANGSSSTFDIQAGAASTLAFTEPPTDGTTDLKQTVRVGGVDAYGNVDLTYTGTVDLDHFSGPGACFPACPQSQAAVAGVATFANLQILTVGSHTLQAIDVGNALGPVTSNAFVRTPGTPDHPVITTLVVPTWSTNVTRQIQVEIRDAQDNVVTTAANNVALSINNFTADGSAGVVASPVVISGGGGVNAVSGVATFSGIGLNAAGDYDLVATAVGVTNPVSAVQLYTVIPGPAYSLEWLVPPTDTVAGANIAAMDVRVLDQKGNHVYTATTPVTLSFGSNPGGGTLTGAGPLAAVAGIATFNSTKINKTGVDYTLVANAALPDTQSDPSPAFDITEGAAAKIAFTVQPQAGSTDSLQTVIAQIQDANGNLIASDNTTVVNLNINTSPAGANCFPIVVPCFQATVTGGIATFNNVRFDKPGAYTLIAAETPSAGLTDGISSSFNLTFGAASQLAFVTGPIATTADQNQQVQVAVEDSFGNPVTNASNQVTITLSTNPSSANFTGGGTVTAVSGVATYTAVNVDKTGVGFQLTATAPGVTSTLSALFDITPGAAAKLVYASQPGNSNPGVALGAFTIRVADSKGNTVTSDNTTQVALSIGSGPTGATIAAGSTATAAAGIATFTPTFNTAGTYTVTGTSSGLTSTPASNPFNINAVTATKIVFKTQPANATSDTLQAIRLEVQDNFGNMVTGTAGTFDLIVNSGPGVCTSGCFVTQALAAGFVNTSVQLNLSGTYTLTTTDTAGLTNDVSNSFTISAGLPTHLAFASGPVSTAADQTQAIQGSILDAANNLVSAGNYAVTLSKGACTGTLSGGGVSVSSAGIVSFPLVGVTAVQGACQLVLSSPGLTSANASFAVTPGDAVSIRLVAQPTNAVANVNIAPAITAELYDLYGNLCTNDNSTQALLELVSNGPGGTLMGTTQLTAVSGLYTFNAVKLQKAGTGYTIRARRVGSPSYFSDPSNSFDITAAAAASLSFTTQPAAATTDTVQTVAVSALDAFGNVNTGYVSTVTLTENLGPGDCVGGCPALAAVNGVATFSGASGIRINNIGNHRLHATDGGFTVDSNTFAVSAGAAAGLSFISGPVTQTADQYQSVSVQLVDSFGFATTGTNVVSLSIRPGFNPGNSTLTGGGSSTAVNGVATFDSVNLNKTGTNYQLRATSTGLTTANSGNFDITAGAVAGVAFGQAPTNVAANTNIAPAVTVKLVDQFGNQTASTNNVTITIASNPGSSTLVGGGSTAAVAGTATFAGLQLDKVASGYTLTATSGSFTATSSGFNVTAGAAAQLVFVNQPLASQTAGANWQPVSGASVSVAVADASGNTVTTNNGTVITITETGTGSFTGVTNQAATVNGIATFSLLNYNTAEAFTVSADEAGALTNPTAVNVTVNPAAAAKLGFTSQPGAGPFAISSNGLAFQVAIQDAFGNTVTTSSAAVTMTIGVNPGSGALQGAGALPVSTSGGIASWAAGINGIVINRPGAGYQVQASASGLTAALSTAFTLQHGSGDHLLVSTEPVSSTTDDQQTVIVEVLDPYGNIVTGNALGQTGSNANVTIDLYRNVPPLTLSNARCATGCTTVAAAAGAATFTGGNALRVNTVGNSYLVRASSGVLTTDDSGNFNISVGAPFQVTTNAPNVAPTTDTTQSVTVTVQDSFANPVLASGTPVTLDINAGPVGSQFAQAAPSTTLLGTQLSANTSSAGVATFSVRLSTASVVTYTLRGTNTNTGHFGDSAAVTVSTGAASKLAFTTQPPVTAVAAANIAPQVSVEDALGNVRTGDNATIVTLAIGNNPGSSVLSATTNPDTVAAGVADFGGTVSLNKTGTAYTLTAAAAGLTGATSSAFNITPGAAASLAYLQQPSNVAAASAITPSITVQVLDAQGNVRTNDNATLVTLVLNANPGASTLGGTLANTVSAGVATFSDITLDKTGTGYTLNATGVGTTTSSTFNVVPGAPATLAFLQSPLTLTEANTTMQYVAVGAYDASGNLATNASGNITLTPSSNVLASASNPTLTKALSNGYAVWDDLDYDTASVSFDLTATLSSPVITVSETLSVGTYDAADRAVSRVSRNAASATSDAPGGAGTNDSYESVLSGTGRYVVFQGTAEDVQSDITPVGTLTDIYWTDRDADGNGIYDEIGIGKVYTVLVSVTPSFAEGNASSGYATVSGDGRYVSFESTATDLVSVDANGGVSDCFVRDMILGVTEMISLDINGGASNNPSTLCRISASGRYVAFQSAASDLITTDTNGASDVFLRDRVLGITERVSLTSAGAEIAGASTLGTGGSLGHQVVSSDGRRVIFISAIDGIVSGDTGGRLDVYVRDRTSSTTTRMSVNRNGLQLDGNSNGGVISADGSRVAFDYIKGAVSAVASPATTAGRQHVYVRTVASALSIQLVSISDDGTAEGNNMSWVPSISADGTVISFQGTATNLLSAGQSAGFAGQNVYSRNTATARTLLLSVDTPNATVASGSSSRSSVSLDGRYVTFSTDATNLDSSVPSVDTNAGNDVIVNSTSTTVLP